MHTRKAAIPSLLGGLAVLWAGCCNVPFYRAYDVGSAVCSVLLLSNGALCLADGDCRSGFCDRETCADREHEYGEAPCTPGPPTAASEVIFTSSVSVSDPCKGLVCLEDRCRSCRSDAECQEGSRQARCLSLYLPGHKLPGKRCEIPSKAHLVPLTAAGGACAKDADCDSEFCDLGICADRHKMKIWSYGIHCELGPPHAPENLDVRTKATDPCGGLLCIDHRCRSCTSDAECQSGSSDSTCLSYPDFPGKRCGNPSDAVRGPKRPQPKL